MGESPTGFDSWVLRVGRRASGGSAVAGGVTPRGGPHDPDARSDPPTNTTPAYPTGYHRSRAGVVRGWAAVTTTGARAGRPADRVPGRRGEPRPPRPLGRCATRFWGRGPPAAGPGPLGVLRPDRAPPRYPDQDRSWLRAVRTTAPVEPRPVEPCPPPLTCRLLVDPGDDAPPAEARGGGYRPQPVPFREAGEWMVNDADVHFADVPAARALGVDLTDADGRRLWTVLLLDPTELPDGATVVIPAGVLVLRGTDWTALLGGHLPEES